MEEKAVIVHSLDHARAALAAAGRAGVPVTLLSAPGAAAHLGAAVFRDMIAQAASANPGVPFTAVLDCGDAPGLALNALRQGIGRIRVSAPAKVRERIADIAARSGAVLDEDDGARPLDLLDAADPFEACRAWLDED